MKNDVQQRFRAFLNEVNAEELDATWERQSRIFRDFWSAKILNEKYPALTDVEIDEIVLILDSHAKGHTKGMIAVAKTMRPQGVWRRLFREIQSRKKLKDSLSGILNATDEVKQAELINGLYTLNKDQKNSLTGQSGVMINAMLFAYNPHRYVSVVSLKHRRSIIERLQLPSDVNFEQDSPGAKIVKSNAAIINGFRKAGIDASPYLVSLFLYRKLKAEWQPQGEPEPEPGEDVGEDEPSGEESAESKSSFYMEKELENFLISNWDRTELAKKYDLIEEEGEMVSQQYPTGIGKIDILVRDKTTAQYVVIELKKNQTSDDTIGQLTRYMGWLKMHKTSGKAAKGIIIASAYDAKLFYALTQVNDVEVYTYQVDFKLKPFGPGVTPSGRRGA